MARVQTNLSLGQLGRCLARVARKSGEPEVNLRAAKQGYARRKKGTEAYALEVPGYGLLICMPGSPPVPGDMKWQTDPAFLRAALRAVEQWATAAQVKWPSGRGDARRDYGLNDWPPSPEEIKTDQLRRARAQSPVSEPAEASTQSEPSHQGLHVAQASESEEVPSSTGSPVHAEASEDGKHELGYGGLLVAADLASGFSLDENGLVSSSA